MKIITINKNHKSAEQHFLYLANKKQIGDETIFK